MADTRIVLQHRLTQQLVMTPQLRQAIKILQVSRAELETLIDQELTENPVLEEHLVDDKPDGEIQLPTVDGQNGLEEWQQTEAPAQPEVAEASSIDQIDWKEFAETYSNDMHGSVGGGSRDDDDERRPALENILVKRTLLPDHLMWQLRLSDLPEADKEIGALIIGSLDKDGYLTLSVEEIAFLANVWPDTSMVDRVLRRIQDCDPPGVAARDLAECLLIQLRQLGLADDALPSRIVRDHLVMLESRRFDRLARELGCTIEQVAEATKIVSVLEPKPGRDFSEGETRYVTPDVYVQKVGDEYVVTLNEDGLPRLRVSSFYRQMLGGNGSPEARGYIQEKMRAAAWLIKSIHQRQRTLYMVTSSIVKFQMDFLDRGVAHLRPLVLKDVANDIGMHESTVSRATAGKYVHTPQGTFELKYFFTSSLRSGHGEEVSAESVKEKIRTIIAKEDARKPLSDQYIAELLAKEQIDIARRTVAKYRELMGILPSSKRKQVY
ncbi:MAG TPA: RNA polymerase factor sigma-54 [Candidatus Binatia bacterium]|jgi:RNA polymerase sigma-54 factor|nr:RNA polymerase factor sigma-54 [Candidatus Binatia bacterium]